LEVLGYNVIKDIVLLGGIGESMARWHEKAGFWLDVSSKSDALDYQFARPGKRTNFLSETGFDDFIQSCKRSTKYEKHVAGVDRIDIAALCRIRWRGISRQSQSCTNTSRTMFIRDLK